MVYVKELNILAYIVPSLSDATVFKLKLLLIDSVHVKIHLFCTYM